MELTNEFRVSVPVQDAWDVLTDVERIAPCLPGAQLQEIEGDEYRGVVKVKVGPITAQYKGKATFKSKDDTDHVAVLKAEGRDTRGQGNASALITATLTPDGDGTVVRVETNLTITGKVAQFGRGVLVDVSGKLLTQFVECLEHDLLSSSSMAAASSASSSSNGSTPAAAPAKAAPAAAGAAAPAKATPEPVAASAASSPARSTPAPKAEPSKTAATTPPVAASAARTSTSAPAAAAKSAAPAAPAKKADAPVEKSTPEPIAASAAPPATPTAPTQPASKVDAPVEKTAPPPVPAQPKAGDDQATPPHGDKLQPRQDDKVGASASTSSSTTTATATPKVSDTATPPHGDQLTDDKPKVRKIEHKAAEPVDLLDAAGVPVAKRAVPLVAGVLVILWFLRRRRNRRR